MGLLKGGVRKSLLMCLNYPLWTDGLCITEIYNRKEHYRI